MDFSMNYLQQSPRIVAVLFIVGGGILLHFFICRLFGSLANRQHISDTVLQICKRASKWILVLLVFLFLLQQFGIKVSTIVTSLLAVSAMVAVGFIAIWSVLSNFLCSFLLMVFSPFRVGDEIEICEVVGGAGLRGRVVDFNIMYTSILEAGEQPEESRPLIRIPNNTFFQKAIKRWKGEERKSIEKHLIKKSILK